MNKKWIAFFAAFIITFSLAGTAAASTIYINSSTGNDNTGTGSSGSPYATFTKGYSVANPNDTLNITGTLSWANASETASVSGTGFTIAKNLTVVGQTATTTFIQASSSISVANRPVFTVNSGVTFTVKNLTIRYGVATGGSDGGGITDNGTVSIQNAIIDSNTYNTQTYQGAGGIYVANGSTLSISSSTISNNQYNGFLYGAGGVYAEANNDVVSINASTFTNNSSTSSAPTAYPYSYADPAGGFGMRAGTNLIITDSTFVGNSTNSYGGAMNLQLTSSVIITNSTIVGNTSQNGAAGILYTSGAGNAATLSMENDLLSGNTDIGSNAGDDFYAYDSTSAGDVIDNGYNLVEFSNNKTWTGTGDLTGNQMNIGISGSLAANGTTDGVQTLALSSGSVAINAGSSVANSGVAIPVIDERGLYRTGPVDIGAYEYNGAASPDTNPPVITISSGLKGLYVGSTTVTLVATGSDDIGIAGVQFKVNGTNQGSLATTSPYTVQWDPTGLSAGAYTIAAVATDDLGNSATDTATITVDHTPPTLTLQTQIPSTVFATSATYYYLASYGADPVSVQVTSCGNGSQRMAGPPATSTTDYITVGNLLPGYSYQCNLEYVNQAGYPSNVLSIGPFSVGGSSYTSGSGGVHYASTSASVLIITPALITASSSPVILTGTSTIATSTPTVYSGSGSLLAAGDYPLLPLGSRNLKAGMSGSDVTALQRYLNDNGFPVAVTGAGSLGEEGTYFGAMTRAALSKWQSAKGISPSLGNYGPLTRAAMGVN